MKKTILPLALIILSSLLSPMAQASSVRELDEVLSLVKGNLPEDCMLVKQSVLVGVNPEVVNFRYNLVKGSRLASKEFDQERQDFSMVLADRAGDVESFIFSSADNKLTIKFNSKGEVSLFQLNGVACKKRKW